MLTGREVGDAVAVAVADGRSKRDAAPAAVEAAAADAALVVENTPWARGYGQSPAWSRA